MSSAPSADESKSQVNEVVIEPAAVGTADVKVGLFTGFDFMASGVLP